MSWDPPPVPTFPPMWTAWSLVVLAAWFPGDRVSVWENSHVGCKGSQGRTQSRYEPIQAGFVPWMHLLLRGQEVLLWPSLYFLMPIYTKNNNIQIEKWPIPLLKVSRCWFIIQIEGNADLPSGTNEWMSEPRQSHFCWPWGWHIYPVGSADSPLSRA